MAAAYLATSVYFTFPLLASGARLGVSDWDAILFHHASVMKSVYEYGQWPFWNPWFCGGNVLWQNPQVALLTPVYVFALALPLATAMKLNILLHYLVGFAGMHLLLTRVFKLTFLPAIFFLAATFTLAGGAAFHLVVGHATFLPYFYLPWILLGFLSALATGALRYAVGAGALLALSIYAGGIHVTFMAAVGLGCFSLISALLGRDWRPLAMLSIAGLFALLFAAPKLVPIARFVANPALVDIRYFPPGPDRVSAEMLQHAFTDADQYPRLRFDGQLYGWHEYGNYLGPLGLLIIAAAFAWIAIDRPLQASNRLGVSLALTTAVLFALMLGDGGPYAPYVLLHRLPVFSQFRLPSRYTLVFTWFAVAMVAWAFGAIAVERSDTARMRRFVAIVLIVAVGGLAYWSRRHIVGSFPLAPLNTPFRLLARPGPPAVDSETDGFGPNSPMLRAMMDRNQGVLKCNEPLQLPGAVQAGGPPLLEEGDAQISDVAFTPNRIRFGVVSRAGGRVILNQRYVAGWRSSVGAFEIDPLTQLAAIRVPPGTAAKVELSFVPRGLISGSILLLIGLMASAAIWRRTLPPRAPANNGPVPAVQPA